MGLDMYLYKKHYIKSSDYNVSVKEGNKKAEGINTERIVYVIEEVAYWRKFNALHKYFVNICQDGNDDCKEYWVSRDDLIGLVVRLRQIKDNPKSASELLPTEEGFFFGSQDYDEYYYNEVDDTLETIQSLLDEDNSDDYYYRASW